LFILSAAHPVRDGFALDRGQDHVVAVGDDHGARPSSAGDVDRAVQILRVLHKPLDRRRLRAHHRDHPVSVDHVPKPYVYKQNYHPFIFYNYYLFVYSQFVSY